MSTKILVVEDDSVQREVLNQILRKDLGFNPVPASDARTALSILKEDAGEIRLVILDMWLPDMSGMEVLETLTQRYPGLPVIILTGHKDITLAVRSMKAGAFDFLTKPPEKERLHSVLQNALKISMLEKEVSRLKRKEDGTTGFDNLIGYDAGLAEVVKIGRKAAASDIPVLLTGETGTGKEVFARAIHGESHRVGKPFIAVNCGALPENLVESILFGHEKGAFTGAIAKSPGKFREADGGTIFLDEVGDLPLAAQVKLLRVLQQKEISPVGATNTVHINVRIISATHRDLDADVATGRFREDLYFRLNVLSIHMPRLSDRQEDIPALTRHFIERFAAIESRPLKILDPEAEETIRRWPWSGNVRELENALHRAMVLSDNPILTLGDFMRQAEMPPHDITHRPGAPSAHYLSLLGSDGLPRVLAEIEMDAMEFGLTHYNGNITKAAHALGMAKSTFYRRLKALRKEDDQEQNF
jgi:DNA-binding NtrC family response regulator